MLKNKALSFLHSVNILCSVYLRRTVKKTIKKTTVWLCLSPHSVSSPSIMPNYFVLRSTLDNVALKHKTKCLTGGSLAGVLSIIFLPHIYLVYKMSSPDNKTKKGFHLIFLVLIRGGFDCEASTQSVLKIEYYN